MHKNLIEDLVRLIGGLFLTIHGFLYFRNRKRAMQKIQDDNKQTWFYTKTKIGLFLERLRKTKFFRLAFGEKETEEDLTSFTLSKTIIVCFLILVGLDILLMLVFKWLGYVTPDGYLKLR